MIIIIDAYNILKQIRPAKEIGEREREAFINRIGNYCRAKGHHAIIVFDGGFSERPVKERHTQSTVIYAGMGSNADTYIMQYLDDHKALDLLLVSSDRELMAYAQRLRITSMDSWTFYTLLNQTDEVDASMLQKQEALVKTMTETTDEVDQLLQLDRQMHTKSEDMPKLRTSSGKKKSKLERSLHKKIRKL